MFMESYISGNIEESDAVRLAKNIEGLVAKKSEILPLNKIE